MRTTITWKSAQTRAGSCTTEAKLRGQGVQVLGNLEPVDIRQIDEPNATQASVLPNGSRQHSKGLTAFTEPQLVGLHQRAVVAATPNERARGAQIEGSTGLGELAATGQELHVSSPADAGAPIHMCVHVPKCKFATTEGGS